MRDCGRWGQEVGWGGEGWGSEGEQMEVGTTLMTGPTPTQGHLPPPSRKCLFS